MNVWDDNDGNGMELWKGILCGVWVFGGWMW